MKSIVKKVFIVICCGALFFGASYMYLNFNFNKDASKTDQKDYTVPYKQLPENTGIAFLLPDNSAVMTYLDFEKNCINVVNIDYYDPSNSLYFGYMVNFTVEVNYELIGGIVDRIGGINLEIDGETLRYTGVQVIDLISVDFESNIKDQIVTGIFNQISKIGFLKEDFVYIIENSKSNLSIIDCVLWLDYIDSMYKSINYVA